MLENYEKNVHQYFPNPIHDVPKRLVFSTNNTEYYILLIYNNNLILIIIYNYKSFSSKFVYLEEKLS